MTNTQKIIKICAQAFAIFLIVTIISGIISAVYGIGMAVMPSKNENTELKEFKCNDIVNNIEHLELNIDYSNVEILKGTQFKIETDNAKLRCKANNNTVIVEEKNNILKIDKKSTIKFYVPNLNELNIELGAGKLKINDIETRKLNLNLGAGNTIIENINAKKVDIETGAGNFDLKNSIIGNLDFDMGLGNAYISSKLDEADIDAGVGNLEINIDGNKNDYLLEVSKALGQILVDDVKIEKDEIIGSGYKEIKIDGGIGQIKVKFEQK